MFGMGKAQRLSLTMQVETQLKDALMVGMLKPGARLVTSEIAAQLGTSITPVREALLRLVSAGALEATPAKAFLVPVMPLSRYQEITLIRKQLEGLAVAQAATAMDADKLAHLHALNGRFRCNKRGQNIEASLKANREFRFTLYGYADMPTLVSLIEQLWVQIGPCFNYLYPQSAEIVHSQHNYDQLLQALAQGDSQRCVNSIHKAIDDGVSILENNYFKR